MKKPKFSTGWMIFWIIMFCPAVFIQLMLHNLKMKEYEVYLLEKQTKR